MVEGVDALIGKFLRKFLLVAIVTILFLVATSLLNRQSRTLTPDQLDVAIAAPVQVFLAAGDRFLAANLGVTRLTVLNVLELDRRDYPILGKAHVNAVFLNPCHEDNYYIGQAFLPWVGEFDAANTLLDRAFRCRTWDVMPGYYLAFNAYYFQRNFLLAGQYFEAAAGRGDEQQRNHLLFMASKFYEKSEDLELAANTIRSMEKSTSNKQLQLFLEARALRVEMLAELRRAAEDFTRRFGQSPESLETMLAAGVIGALPTDPLGKGFFVDADGVVQARN